MKTNSLRMRGKIAALAIALCGGCAFHGHGGTVVAGTSGGTWFLPFAISADGTAHYTSRYQQIYTGTFFPVASVITRIGFMSVSTLPPGNITYDLSIAFGTTARMPSAPGTEFVSGATPVFSGSVLASLTPAAGDFDFSINLSTPFLYDPAAGNLLLEVTVISATGTPGTGLSGAFGADFGEPGMGILFVGKAPVESNAHLGLVTQFTTAPVPEPGVAGLALAGGVLSFGRIRSARGWAR